MNKNKVIDAEKLFSQASEAAVIGSMIIDPTCIDKVTAIVQVDDFYLPQHKILYGTIVDLHSENNKAPTDCVLMRDRLEQSNQLENTGGVTYLAKILENVPSSANAVYYAKIVQEKSKYRKLITIGERIQEIIDLTDGDVGESIYQIKQIAEGLDGAVEPYDSQPIIRILDDVEVKPITWLWYNKIPRGMLTLFFGNPGLLKTWLALYIAVKITIGGTWPDKDGLPDNRAPLGSVVLLTAEDPLDSVIKPRLLAMGADPKKIIALEAVRITDENGRKRQKFFSLQDDLSALKQAIRPDTKLIIIDPISAYYGPGVDSHRDSDIRGILAPLCELAEQTGIAVIAITHLNKNLTGKAIYRALGSIGLIAAARTAWLISEDPKNPDSKRRLLTPAKHNVLIEPTGLAFSVVDGKIVFENEAVHTTADECLGLKSTVDAPALKQAKEWLSELLPPGKSIASTELANLADKNGITKSTLRRAKDELRVNSYPLRIDGKLNWFMEIPSNNE